MISPEIIRRYPFFASLTNKQIEILAMAADEMSGDIGHRFIHEGDELTNFYLVLEGALAIVVALPNRMAIQSVADQLTGELDTREVVVSTVGTGDVFGWSGLIPPHQSSAGVKAVTPCRVIAFDCEKLMRHFAEDYQFGMVMTQKAASVIRDRLRDMRIESLAFIAE